MIAGDEAVALARNPARDPAWRPRPGDEARARTLHRALDGYAPSPLHAAPALAGAVGAGAVLLKDESARFGLPAFKALGAWWAAARTVAEHLGAPSLATQAVALRERAAGGPRLRLACATEGNHGRAVARVARSLGLGADVVVPAHTTPARVAAIEAEGAAVRRIDGDYDAAVRHAAGLAGPQRLVIADTSWPGYEEVPRLVVEGYGTIFAELDEQLAGRRVDLVLVPIGVGSLAAAAARHLRAGDGGPGTLLVGVEPMGAACALASARAGAPVTVPSGPESIMAGLNCATPSPAAWPAVSAAFDAFCAVGDGHARRGLRRLAGAGLDRGACAGGVAGALEALLGDPERRSALGLLARPTVLALLTEGVTDPEVFAAAVGRPPRADRAGYGPAMASNEKPQVDVPSDQPPSYQLELEDLVVGDGEEAVSGKVVEVHYVGVSWKDGKQFDASWDRGDTFKFGLGKGQVIPGWDQGVAGMRVGGRRRITIPPNLAYGKRGAGGVIGPDETLVFVVDLVGLR